MHKLFEGILSVERIAKSSRANRMLNNPAKYLNAILHRKLLYNSSKKEKPVVSTTFFGTDMHLMLPSSTDIYLTGGKSHDSEIRLAKFLIKKLKKGDTFVDVGAHYGYFSLLASTIVGKKGKVYAFEASSTTYTVLEKNRSNTCNLFCFNQAVSNCESKVSFFEFPNLFAEHNTSDIDQYRKESWFSNNQPKETKIDAIRLDIFLKEQDVESCIIKIDVEGGELNVIEGLSNYLADNNPLITMEYLSEERGNEVHRKAESLLQSFGYFATYIDAEGALHKIDSAADYMKRLKLESDNIVFKK